MTEKPKSNLAGFFSNKLYLFLIMIAFIFGYTTYEAVKLEKKLGQAVSEILIKEIPKDLRFTEFGTGKPFDMRKQQAGKHLVHFWATWCAPCEVEFPDLVEFINLMRENKELRFYLVAVNDDDQKVKKFLSQFELNSDQVVLLKDNFSDYQKFGSYKLPESFVFDKSFQTIRKFEGQQSWTQKTIVNYFKSI